MNITDLRADETLITATDLQARALQLAYGRQMRDSGAQAWQKPRIRPFYQWMLDVWSSRWPSEQLLHPVHEIALFKYAIDSSGAGRGLLSTVSTARQATKADRWVTQYGLDLTNASGIDTPETAAFAEWTQHVSERKATMGWRSADEALLALIEAVETGDWQPENRLRFITSARWTPLQHRLFKTLKEQGADVEHVSPSGTDALHIAHRRPASEDDEVLQTAQAIQRLLPTGHTDADTLPRIAVVVPDIDAYRSRIQRLFTDVLNPAARQPSTTSHPVAWRFAKGCRLIEHELIHAAFIAVELDLYRNALDLLTRWLLNKRYGNGPEYLARTGIDFALRQQNFREAGLNTVLSMASKGEYGPTPRFVARIKALIELLEASPGKQAPSAWAAQFAERLQILGWPGDESLNSTGHQAMTHWEDSLAILAAMDRQLKAITVTQAQAWLREALNAQRFEARVKHQQPIQVLSLEDCEGLQFDHAFVLGLDAQTLPRPRSPNPFLPVPLQIDAGIPSASAESALKYAQDLLSAAYRIAPHITLSCPMHSANGADTAPSPLVTDWPAEGEAETAPSVYRQCLMTSGPCAELPDADPAPPVSASERDRLGGGVAVLEDYAEMPFIAFARHRLGARAFPIPRFGLTQAEQGVIVHALLERIWMTLKDSETLKEYTPEALVDCVTHAMDAAEAEGALLPKRHMGARLITLEKRRLTDLLVDWLTHEQARAEPFTVEAHEVRQSVTLKGLSLNIRIDRIDKVHTPSDEPKRLLIDYKTGRTVTPNGWRPDTLSQPQLPLYALDDSCLQEADTCVDGIAFAHVRTEHHGFHIASNWAGSLTGGKPSTLGSSEDSWQDLQSRWRRTLESYALGFMEGDIRADRQSRAYRMITQPELRQLMR